MNDAHTFVIAEIGINHQGSLDLFKKMIVKAKECGVDAVKSQKRDPKECLTPEQYNRPYESRHAFGKTYGEHKEALELSQEAWKEAMAMADDLGIPLFASVFDITSARFMRTLGAELIKIGSAEVTRLEETLTLFGGSVRQWSDGQLDTSLPRAQKRSWMTAGSLAWAGVAVLLVMAVTVSVTRRGNPPEMADAAVLEQVNKHVSRAVPGPMEPLQKLVQWEKE